MPRLFRRSTGAHAILVLLVGADLLETIGLVLIGGLVEPVLVWIAHATLHWMHGSLLGAIGLVLILALCTFILIEKWTAKTALVTSVGCMATGALPIVSLLVLLWLIKPDWIAIPAAVIPFKTLEPFPWPLPFLAPGVWIARCIIRL